MIQDLIAIFVLIVLYSGKSGVIDSGEIFQALLFLPILSLFSYIFVKYILINLISRFDKFQEYIFLIAIGWCLGLSELANAIGLSKEIGAFIAGISLATSPISQFIALNLKPLRDFFLILFFFVLGAQLQLDLLKEIFIPAITLAIVMIVLKPFIFRVLLQGMDEHKS